MAEAETTSEAQVEGAPEAGVIEDEISGGALLNGLRDRITSFERIRAGDIAENPGNWRVHGDVQRKHLRSVLGAVGIVDALILYPSERNGGKLTLIDGHLRRGDSDPDQEWPSLITNLSDAEADVMLLTLDRIAAMAESDQSRVDALVDAIRDESTPDLLTGDLDELLAALRTEEMDGADANAPDAFPAVDSDVNIDFKCPRCSYEWSGKAK